MKRGLFAYDDRQRTHSKSDSLHSESVLLAYDMILIEFDCHYV